MSLARDPTPCADHPDAVRRVRDALDRAGFQHSNVQKLLALDDGVGSTFRRRDLPRLLRRVAGDSPLETLIRSFVLGRAVSVEQFRQAIAPGTIEDWLAVRMIEPDGERILPDARIISFDHLLLASEIRRQAPIDPKLMVMPPSGSTEKLARLTIRRPVGSALDLGCGSGVHALLAAGHCGRVVATDVNPRAVDFARFNALLNGFNIECFEGNWLGPVQERQFDLVVSNPPYVVSPGSDMLYRDGGQPGDWMSEKLVREVPAHLKPGGFAQFNINWAQRTGEDWLRRLASWTDGSGCDVWVLCFDTTDPASYTTSWAPAANDDVAGFERQFDEWMAFFERERIEAIGNGLITLRKSPGGGKWLRCDDAPGRIGNCGIDVVKGFEQFDFLRCHSTDDGLLATRFRAAPEAALEITSVPSTVGEWRQTAFRLKRQQGLAYGGQVNALVARLITRIEPTRTLREALTDAANEMGHEPAVVIEQGMPLIRTLILQATLLPVDS